MKCTNCGSLSFDELGRCEQCGEEPLPTRDDAPAPSADGIPEELFSLRLEIAESSPEPEATRYDALTLAREQASAELLRRGKIDLAGIEELVAEVEDSIEESLAGGESREKEGEPVFTLEDDLIPPLLPGLEYEEIEGGVASPLAGEPGSAGPEGLFFYAEPRDSLIDRDDEVPERFWTAEGAGMGRRVVGLLVDHALLGAALALFFGGAYLSFHLSEFDPSLLLSPRGLAAAALPFVLLAVLLGLSYFTFFHGWLGRTPGKGLAGIEVRTVDGSGLSYGRAFVRSLLGLASLACAGVGLAWAVFEPRRRGWADLLSHTVVGERTRRGERAGRRSLTRAGGNGKISRHLGPR
jgi:uncharacterized RDD family membrane protein YckC